MALVTTFNAYDGPEMPASDLAVIWWGGGAADAVDIDGKPVGHGVDNVKEAEILPGQHTVRYGSAVQWGARGIGGIRSERRIAWHDPVEFLAEAGHRYQLKAEDVDWSLLSEEVKVVTVVVDEADGRVVARGTCWLFYHDSCAPC